MPRGSKPGERRGGRQKGVPNSKTAERIAKAEASGLMPHEFLLSVCRGETQKQPGPNGTMIEHIPTFDERIDAAKAAIGYYAPKLSSIQASGPEGGALQIFFSTDYEKPD